MHFFIENVGALINIEMRFIVKNTIIINDSCDGLVPNRRQTIDLTNKWPTAGMQICAFEPQCVKIEKVAAF